MHDLALVAFEGAARHKHSLSNGKLVFDALVQLALLEEQVISAFVCLRKGIIDELEASVDDLVALDCQDAIGLPHYMHVSRLLD